MLTLGIDLAAEPRGTAAALLRWDRGEAVVEQIAENAGDDRLVALAGTADAIGVDCPLGWPAPFVDFVRRHHDGLAPAVDAGVPGWRRGLTLRETDRRCIEHTRELLGRAVRPLSVSADLLGHVAMRCAVLLAAFERAGVEIDRSGTAGRLAEVYPAASLALWQLTDRSYKGSGRRDALAAGVGALGDAAPWLRWSGDTAQRCRASDHAFDAVVAALATRAWATGAATGPATDAERAVARTEGWIALPTCGLAGLVEG